MVTKMRDLADEELREAVLSQIEWEPEISSTRIGVTAEDGVVTLTGVVDSFPERLAAEKAAKKVYGVRAVANDIDVRLPYERTDAEIARDALQALKAHIKAPEDKVKVTISKGWVTLEGSVDWDFQRKVAEEVVSYLGGVRGVSNLIELNPQVKASSSEVKTKIEGALRRMSELDARRIWVEVRDNTVRPRRTGRVANTLDRD
jgi:osmotically-inducible protein OsmY